MDLFEQTAQNNDNTPLAERMRPQVLEDVVGQKHLLGPRLAPSRASGVDFGAPRLPQDRLFKEFWEF